MPATHRDNEERIMPEGRTIAVSVDRLKLLMRQKNLDAAGLARKIGNITPVAVRAWLNGRSKPYRKYLDRLLEVLECSESELVASLSDFQADLSKDLIERIDRFYTEYADPTEMPMVRDLAVKYMGDVVAPLERLMGWLSVNPRVFKTMKERVRRGDHVLTSLVGYCSFRPITTVAIDLLDGSLIDGAGLLPEHILRIGEASNAVYIGGVVAKEGLARAAMIVQVKSEVSHYRDMGVKVFYTKPLTYDGLRMATNNGFLPIQPDHPATCVYRLRIP